MDYISNLTSPSINIISTGFPKNFTVDLIPVLGCYETLIGSYQPFSSPCDYIQCPACFRISGGSWPPSNTPELAHKKGNFATLPINVHK